MKSIAVVLAGFALLTPQAARGQEAARWAREAQHVTIIRDDWGIPHIYGKTDADAVFGLEYAQAEDDFNRVETNYLTALGWTAQAEGEAAVVQDLRQRLFINTDSLKAQYAASPRWLKKLMDAFADGLNFYLAKHPDVKPRVITHFEPWMALSFTEGSIGGDIERVNLHQLAAFYGGDPAASAPTGGDGERDVEPSGSNGVAIAPANTVNHRALLLINPHTSFFFRAEVQVVSEQGLDAYGAVTWGQFFVYQGFNDRAGWMHTSSGVDAVDEYLETVAKQGDQYIYRYGGHNVSLPATTITIPYKTATGMATKTFTVYRTLHGPVIRKVGDQWVTIRLMQKPIEALTQSFTRTKARSYQAYRKTMELKANSSNNTIFADADGDIAYFHGNFIPRRDTTFDWTNPVDGSNPATEWNGLLAVDETPHLLNPASGWLYNSNNWPWSAAGPSSPRREDFPKYVETGGESARGRHAIRVLSNKQDFTVAGLRDAAFDSYLPWFEQTVPPLLKAWDEAPDTSALKTRLAAPVAALRGWDLRWSATSVPTTLAVFWGEAISRQSFADARRAGVPVESYVAERATPAQLLQALGVATDRLTADFGTWQTPWGDINRFQRFNDDIDSRFDDGQPSIPVPFTSSIWGSLASFGARPYPNTKKWYGTSGNSFVAIVEFGDSVRAVAVTAGGESGHPGTAHFNDEAARYAGGDLRPVYFYRSQLVGHTERTYHPGS